MISAHKKSTTGLMWRRSRGAATVRASRNQPNQRRLANQHEEAAAVASPKARKGHENARTKRGRENVPKAALACQPYLEKVESNSNDVNDVGMALSAMAVGIQDCKDQIPNHHDDKGKFRESLRQEAQRRHRSMALPRKPPFRGNVHQLIYWLEAHPITDPDCIQFVKAELSRRIASKPQADDSVLDETILIQGRQRLVDNMGRILAKKPYAPTVAELFAAAAADGFPQESVHSFDDEVGSNRSALSSVLSSHRSLKSGSQSSLVIMTHLSQPESLTYSITSSAPTATRALVESDSHVNVAERKLHDVSGQKGVYTGQCLRHLSPNGCSFLEPDGRGRMRYRSGHAVYEGEWKKGQKHGRGKLDYNETTTAVSAVSLSSTKKAQKQQQQQDFSLSYEGDWKHNKRDGQGVQRYASGVCLHSQWVKNRPVGDGHYVFANGVRVAAINGATCRDAKHVWANGSYYEGEWKDGWLQGRGTMGYANGVVLSGGWHKDLPLGKGVYTFSDETRVPCEDGKAVGKHVFADGSEYQGKWDNGAPTG